MTDVEDLKKRHKAASRVKDDPNPSTTSETSSGAAERPSGAFSGVDPSQVAGMLARAQERAGDGLDLDILVTRRLTSVLVRSAYVRQCVIVTQRQRDYLEGLCPFPREEIQALKVLADLSEGNPGFLPGEKTVNPRLDLESGPWCWDV